MNEPVTILSSDVHTQLYFRIGMWWRIIYGGLRIVLSGVLLRLVGTSFSSIFYTLMSHEVVEDPNDLILRAAKTVFAHGSFEVTYFIAAYLFFWGIVDIVLSACLLKEYHAAFPIGLTLIGAFVLYEGTRFAHTHSLILLGVILVDLVIMWLIWKEYRRISLRASGVST